MGLKKTNKKKLQKKLLHKYRLVVLNEDTFEERFAIKLTRLKEALDQPTRYRSDHQSLRQGSPKKPFNNKT